jgi:hypothetical protein
VVSPVLDFFFKLFFKGTKHEEGRDIEANETCVQAI